MAGLDVPLLRRGAEVGDGPIRVASLEGYGAPVIDIGHW